MDIRTDFALKVPSRFRDLAARLRTRVPASACSTILYLADDHADLTDNNFSPKCMQVRKQGSKLQERVANSDVEWLLQGCQGLMIGH